MTVTPYVEPILLLVAGIAFLAWVLLMWGEEETECSARCFRHQSRPRLHVPCFRCQENHPLR